ncbi:tail assembly chaperone [Oceanobacillus jeddahense]|uniref:tail assembly chaperone n=1 Tax=Oceanobacillus jeddahense TaxID=1462527 RepID=UPI000595EBCF|nr:tail assembly chaperone [Oceanobacillus jeddahense]
MEIQIGEKKYELVFGMKFIRKLDEMHTFKQYGQEFGAGVETAMTYIGLMNPTILVDIIKAATSHLNQKPSNNDIENYIEAQASEGKMNDLFKNITEAMEESVFLKEKLQNFKKLAKVK